MKNLFSPNSNNHPYLVSRVTLPRRLMFFGAFALGLALGALAVRQQNQEDDGKAYSSPEASLL